MQIIAFEPENNLVQIGDERAEQTLDYRTFASNYYVGAHGDVVPVAPDINERQREAIALALMAIEDYRAVYPLDPRPHAIQRLFLVGEQDPSGTERIRAHNAALEMASGAYEFVRRVRTIPYRRALRAAMVLSEAIRLEYSQAQFAKAYLRYTELRARASS